MKYFFRHFILTACCFFSFNMVFAAEKSAGRELHVGSLVGPTGIPVAYMYENPPAIENTNVTFESFASPTTLLPKMIKGETDIGFLPANAAAKVYTSSNGAILAAGISGTGTLVLISRDTSVNSFADLKGKKIAVAGQGATPEYMFRYLLAKNSIKEGPGSDAVELDFSFATDKIPAELIAGRIRYAVVPEPFATVVLMKDPSIRRIIDFQKEYAGFNGQEDTYPLTLIVVRRAYAQANPEIVRAFLKAYKQATEWTIANPEQSGVLVQKYTLGLSAPVVAKAIPSCHFVCIDAAAGRVSIEKLLQIFLQFSPESIGGVLPADTFYFK